MPEMTPPPILRHFEVGELSPRLQVVAQPFATLAQRLVLDLPAGVDLDLALINLLKAKASAVKAIEKQDQDKVTDKPKP